MALTGCCGCHNLKRGSIAIAITLIVLSSLTAVVSFSELPAGLDSRPGAPLGLVVVVCAVPLVTIAFNVLLIVGVKRASTSMILCWVVYHAVVFALSSIVVVALIVITVMASGATEEPVLVDMLPGKSAAAHTAINVLALVTAGLGLFNVAEWYWFAVVVSHMNEVGTATDGFAYSRQEEELQGFKNAVKEAAA